MLLSAGLLVLGGQARAQEDQSGLAVSREAIRALRVKWVEPDAETTDANKIRRYESILRTGRQLIREHPEAENLYMVRALMLQATRGLLILGVDDVDREGVIQLARDIVDLQAPPAWRFEADLLLTQVKAAETYAVDGDVRELVEPFIARYEQTVMTPHALISAARMADQYDLSRWHRALLDRLEQEFVDRAGVGAFLYRAGRKVRVEGRSFRARLARVDGPTRILPVDVMGRSTLMLIWDPNGRLAKELFKDLAAYMSGDPPPGSQAFTVSITDDLDAIRREAKAAGADMLLAYLKGGADDPLLESYAVRQVPMFYLLGADGRIYENPQEHLGINMKEARTALERHVRLHWLRRDRINTTRAGLFLVDRLALEADDALVPLCRDILRARLHEAPPARAETFKAIAAKVDRVKAPPSGAQRAMRQVLKWMTLRYVDIQEGRNRLSPQVTALAESMDVSEAEGYAKLAIEAIAALHEAHQADEPGRIIERFLTRWELEDGAWAAEVFGLTMSLETAQDDIRARLLAQMQQRPDTPRVMGLLREGFGKAPWPYKARPVSLTFEDLEGRPIAAPADIQAEGFLVHFWSPEAPIGSQGDYRGLRRTDSLYTRKEMSGGIRVVAVCVGKHIEAARALQAEHPDWLHTVLPGGWDSPALRALDVTRLPSAWLVGSAGSVVLDNTHVSLEEDLPATGKSVSILYHGVRKEDMDDWTTVMHRLHRYMQARQIAGALWQEDAEQRMGMNEAYFRRSLRSVFDQSLGHIMARASNRAMDRIVAALDPLEEDAKSLPPETRDRIAAATVPLARTEERLRRLKEMADSELWAYVHRHDRLEISDALDRLWTLEIHWRDYHHKKLPTQLLDQVFQRIDIKSRSRRRWRMRELEK
jgi:hypothetical protein